MKHLLLIPGLLLTITISFLNTQEQSVAESAPVASVKAAATDILPVIDHSGATEHQKRILNAALLSLPEACRDTLKNLYIRQKKQESRGLAGKTVMILDGTVRSDAELRALFVHESGHNWDLGCLKGTPLAGKSEFSDGDEPIYNDDPSLAYYRISWLTSEVQRSSTRPEDFVSGYASYNIFEDFAESFAYFVLQNDAFAERAKSNEALAKKYVFFRDVFFNGEVPQVAAGRSSTKTIPWDVTKLAYEWHPEQY